MTALNISPMQPINNFGGSIRPINNTPPSGGTRPIGNRPKSAFDSLDVGQINKGRLMTEGSYHKQFGEKRYSGLKGQLAHMKQVGRLGVTQNLSMHNVEQIHDLIAGRLKRKMVGSQTYFSRRDKIAIMKDSRKLVKTKGSDFTWEDRKDLKKTMDTLQQQYKDKILHRDGGADIPSTARPTASSDNKEFINAQPLKPLEPSNYIEDNKLPPKPDLTNLSAMPDNTKN